MKFDICLPNAMEGFLAPAGFAGPKDIEKFAREAERLGYNALWGFDFLNPTPDMGITNDTKANWYELMTTLAYLACVTDRIRLVSGVVVLPNREPVLLAKQIATVDQFSNGRLDVGIGLEPSQHEGLHQGLRTRLGLSQRVGEFHQSADRRVA